MLVEAKKIADNFNPQQIHQVLHFAKGERTKSSYYSFTRNLEHSSEKAKEFIEETVKPFIEIMKEMDV